MLVPWRILSMVDALLDHGPDPAWIIPSLPAPYLAMTPPPLPEIPRIYVRL